MTCLGPALGHLSTSCSPNNHPPPPATASPWPCVLDSNSATLNSSFLSRISSARHKRTRNWALRTCRWQDILPHHGPLQYTPFLGLKGWLVFTCLTLPLQVRAVLYMRKWWGHHPGQQWRMEWPGGRASQDVVQESYLTHRKHREDEGTGSLTRWVKVTVPKAWRHRSLFLGENKGEGIARENPPERKTKRKRPHPPSQLTWRVQSWSALWGRGWRGDCSPPSKTPQAELRTERAQQAGLRRRKVQEGSCCTMVVGNRVVLHSGPPLLGLGPAPWPRVSHHPASRAQRSPHTGQAAPAVLMPGSCYLCMMWLISFLELRHLLKSWVATRPLPAVGRQIWSSQRFFSSLLMASYKANLLVICWMEST